MELNIWFSVESILDHICISSWIAISIRYNFPSEVLDSLLLFFSFKLLLEGRFFTLTVFCILGWFGRLLAVSRVLQHKCAKKCTSDCSQLLSEYHARWISLCGRFPPVAYPKANPSGKRWAYFMCNKIFYYIFKKCQFQLGFWVLQLDI